MVAHAGRADRLARDLALAAILTTLTSCKSADERMREQLPGAWERTATDETATYERRFFASGVYVEKRHDTSATPPPGGRDVIESGTYRVGGKHLYLAIIEGGIAPDAESHDDTVISFDSEEVVLDPGKGGLKWTRLHGPFPDDPDAVTVKALDKTRLELARAAGCLLGGKLDAGPAWPRLVAVARGVALLPSPPEAAKKAAPWPASCASALENARDGLSDLLTRNALERCSKLRRLLRVMLADKPTKVAAYGKVDGDERRIDALAAEAARCGVVGDVPADAVPMDRARPAVPSFAIERGTPVSAPGTKVQVAQVFIASPNAESARFVVGAPAAQDGSAFEGVFCATRGGAAVTAVRCEALTTPIKGGFEPLTSLAEDAPLWFTRGVDGLVRLGQAEIALRAVFAQDGRAFIDRDGTVRGTSSDGTELRVGPDGKATETPGAAPPGRALVRGDLRIVNTAEGFSVSRTGDRDPAKLGRSRFTSSYRDVEACHDGNSFGFIAHDEGHVVAGIPRLDGSLEIVDVDVATDRDRSDQARVVNCEAGVIRLLSLSREGRVTRVTCKPDGCKVDRSDPLPDRGPGALGLAALGERVLVAKLAPLPVAELGLRGQVVYRVADLAQLATAPDRLLLAEPDIDTPDSAEPERLSIHTAVVATRSAAVIAITSTTGMYLFRVDADGSAKALSAP